MLLRLIGYLCFLLVQRHLAEVGVHITGKNSLFTAIQENLKLEQENQKYIIMLAASAKSENRGVLKDLLNNVERLQRDKAKVCATCHPICLF